MAVASETVAAVAAAAGIEIDDERLEEVRALLERVLEGVAELERLGLDGVEPMGPRAQ